jgi:nephrocystin-3
MTASSRLVRVFISSTFRDFIQERDELVKKVFPQLRQKLKERFVELLEVDLRWGITEEQAKGGETLRICLEEIDRCRPDKEKGTEDSPVFFIGLLGERYGWIPERDYFKPDVLEDPNLGWVKEHIFEGKSVTELEILHGVLRNEKMRDKAFFYFRNDGYEKRHWSAIEKHHAATLPPITKEDFTNDKSKTPGIDAEKQRDLKRRVRDASLKWEPKDYETPEDLAALVALDLWEAIDSIFPASSVPDALERESLEHRVFMESRTRAYVEREGLFAQLDEFADSVSKVEEPEEPVSDGEQEEENELPPQPSVRVVLGESGSGKSALLAAWLKRRGDDVVFFHFAGATPSSVSGSSLLRRLLATLKSKGVVPATENIPHADEAMAAILPVWLEKLSERGGGIMLFDAVNQLGSARDRELWWWPEKWPENVRVVFSALPGDSLRAMQKRGWTDGQFVLRIPPLQPNDKREMMNRYLKDLFARGLETHLQDRVLAAPQTANPLFLRTVLDELRLRSAFGTLDKDLDEMLRCADPAALFVHVLKNLERDFTPPEHPELVHRALGLMGVALRGLSENELLQLLSSSPDPAGDPLPRHYWSPLYLALEESLVSREGQLSFFHDYLRSAIWREYLDEEHELEAARDRLAEPVLRWREEGAFGASLRAYGFANGIRHLLDNHRADESAGLLLDKDYREAAARTLHQVRPVLDDIQRVREADAQADSFDVARASDLTVLALTGREQLEAHLRKTLDQTAVKSDWESVMAHAGSEDDKAMAILLACRAISRATKQIGEADIAGIVSVMDRWAETIGKSGWKEFIARVALPDINEPKGRN